MKRADMVAVIGGMVVVVAAFLAWVIVDIPASGATDGFGSPLASGSGVGQTTGRTSLVAGIVIIGAALALSRAGRISNWAPLIGAAAAILAAILMLVTLVDLQQKARVAIESGSIVSIGLGVWLSGAGAILALIGFGRAIPRVVDAHS